jgi:hypothetical protein
VYSTLHANEAQPALIVVGADAGPWSDRLWSRGGESSVRRGYQNEAAMLADALCAHLPQGLIDHLLAELMRRKASLFCVLGPAAGRDQAGF